MQVWYIIGMKENRLSYRCLVFSNVFTNMSFHFLSEILAGVFIVVDIYQLH